MSVKRLVTCAALTILGCSDAATGNSVPAFDSTNWSPNASGAEPAGEAGDMTGSPAAESPTGEPSAPSNPQPANEAQTAKDLQGGNASDSAGSASPPPAAGDMASPPSGMTNDMQGSNGMTAGMGGAPAMATGNPPNPPAPPAPPAPRVYPALDCSATPAALNGGMQTCSSNSSGTVDAQGWFLWSSGTGGCISTFGQDGAFKATWNNSGDFLARMGLQFDETKTFNQYGTIGANLAFTKTGSAGGYSFIGIYGWSNNPLVEYYIVENSFANGVTTPYGTTQRGTFNVDGATYKVYSGTKQNQPSIHGTATFQQYFSVRQSPRQCGHVSISEHFKAWGNMGMTLGKMYEARILVEAGGGQGSISFTTANVSTGG